MDCHNGERTWSVYKADTESSSYSVLKEINKETVHQLKLAWTFKPNDAAEDSRFAASQCNTIIIDGVMYVASARHRILGFAFRYWDVLPEKPDIEIHESGLQFLGLNGIIDPPREEVFDAVAQCKTAGIVPVMITGDHPLTAKTIAERIGILSSEKDLVITGQQLAALDNDNFLAKVEKIKV